MRISVIKTLNDVVVLKLHGTGIIAGYDIRSPNVKVIYLKEVLEL